MELYEIIAQTIHSGGADVYIVPDSPLMLKRRGIFERMSDTALTASDAEILIREIYGLNDNRSLDDLLYVGDDDFSFTVRNTCRIRCCAFRQNGGLGAVLRLVSFALPDPCRMSIPAEVMALADSRKGLILVTGPAGSGKSTTIACMLDKINSTRSGHIVTIEDPIEYIHPPKRGIVSQREVRTDVESFSSALRSAMRQNADVVMLSELPDPQSVQLAVNTAEFGKLVIAGAHSYSVSGVLRGMLDAVPCEQHPLFRAWLSVTLIGVVAQQLLPTVDGGVTPVFDVLEVDRRVSDMIRRGEDVEPDIGGMDRGIEKLYRAGVITRDTAIAHAENRYAMNERI